MRTQRHSPTFAAAKSTLSGPPRLASVRAANARNWSYALRGGCVCVNVAVRSAIEVQNGLIERNAGPASERWIEFRVGIQVGDVVEENDGDLTGDGVNVAA